MSKDLFSDDITFCTRCGVQRDLIEEEGSDCTDCNSWHCGGCVDFLHSEGHLYGRYAEPRAPVIQTSFFSPVVETSSRAIEEPSSSSATEKVEFSSHFDDIFCGRCGATPGRADRTDPEECEECSIAHCGVCARIIHH
eukprot:NODE_8884_length_636_cov_108.939571_g8259_i0.p1 GENE.NODE_8884_length_636_cov_108.939571_g8259_i0~~NODE_8884_length_636_cov_108.939571_g8259_i0.p1  ORF type:complete len:138 (-),score=19.70 NODE_8884_length_636_cov_108.939571_g8259_i0:167-580(-)